jgi:hypothetical protein
MRANQTDDSQRKVARNWPRRPVNGRALIILVVSHPTFNNKAIKEQTYFEQVGEVFLESQFNNKQWSLLYQE